MRSSGSGAPRSKAWVRKATLRVSPSSVAPTSLSSRMTTDRCTPRFGSEITRNSSSSRSGVLMPMTATSTPATLSFVAVRLPWYSASGLGAGEDVGQDDGVLPGRRDQAVDLAAVLGALADRVDVGVVGAQLVVDDDAALHLQPGPDGDVGARPDAGGDDQQVGLELPAVGQADAADAVAADHVGGEDVEVDGDPERLDALLEDRPRLGVQLHVHQVRHGVHELDVQAVALQRAGGLEAEQPAAHHDRLLAAADGVEHRPRLVDGAEAVDAGQQLAVVGADALHRRDERVAAGGEHEVVVRAWRCRRRRRTSLAAVSIRSARTPARRIDAVVGVPVVAVEDDVVLVLLAGQHRRQHDPVVVAVRLVAEDGDPELVAAAALEHLLDEAGAGHAVADDDQPGAGVEVVVQVQGREALGAAAEDRGHQTSTSPRSTTSSPVTPSGAAACSSTTVPPGRSSTTRSGTCTSPFAPIGNQRIGSPSRSSRT